MYSIGVMDCMLKCLCCVYMPYCQICLCWPTINIEPILHAQREGEREREREREREWSYTVMYCLQKGFGLRGYVLLTALCNTRHNTRHIHLEVTGRVERSVSRQGRIWVTPVRKLKNSICPSDNTCHHFTTFSELFIQVFILPLVQSA